MTLLIQSWCAGDPCDPCPTQQPPGGPWPTTPPDSAVQVGIYAIQIGIDPTTGLPNAEHRGDTLIGVGGFYIGDPSNPYVHFPTPLVWNWGPTPINSPYLDGVYYYVFLSYGGADHHLAGDGGPGGPGGYSSLEDGVNAALQFQTYWWG